MIDLDIINELTDTACNDPERLMQMLGIEARQQGKRFAGPCPVHGGDNISAFNFYPDGETMRGFWLCRTHNCQLEWNKNLVGLIQAIKSRELGKKFKWNEAVNWLVKFNGYKALNEVKLPDISVLKRRKDNRIIHKLNILPQQKNSGWTRDWVRKQLDIPSDYYIERGYSKEILDKYDVGYYKHQNRISVPVYDDNYKFCVGFSARSLFTQCNKCNLFHDGSCPTYDNRDSFTKWRNSLNFESSNYLYNFWFAREYIVKTGIAILVEGAGDVWKLEENNIKNSLGLFGVELKEQQRILLDKSGALSLIILLDNDDAGKNAAKMLKRMLGRAYRLYFPTISGHDVGELHADAITKDIKTVYDKVLEKWKI